jgi:FixJ family two-component response regulator
MVYIIDDDESVRRAFRLLLSSAHIDHKPFSCADDFLSSYKEEEKDLLVLDMNLPGLNGIELLETIQKRKLHLTIVVVTAKDDLKNREYCRQYGVKAYMRKPVDGEALLDIIRYSIHS